MTCLMKNLLEWLMMPNGYMSKGKCSNKPTHLEQSLNDFSPITEMNGNGAFSHPPG